MSKPPSRPRGIRMIVDEVIPYDHPKLLGLKRGRHLREQDHRRWIAYGVQCAKELLPNHGGEGRYYREALPGLPDPFHLFDYQKALLDPLPIPGGRGERALSSSAVLASKHWTAEPIIIRRQQEANPYHPAVIEHPFPARLEWSSRYVSTVPQMTVQDLANFDHPFEQKIVAMTELFQERMPSSAGKTRSLAQMPFLTTQLLSRWLQNQAVDPYVYPNRIGAK